MSTPDLAAMTRDLAAMVRIPSVNPYDAAPGPGRREAEIAAWLLTAMADIGLETGREEVAPGRPNVWGRLRGAGGGPTLMLAGHTDTVGVENCDDAPFEARVEDGRLHGRGAVDMKGPLAAMLETARLAKGEALAGDLLLMFVVDEEHLMTGSLFAGGRRSAAPKADSCVVCEPTRLAAAPAHKGQSAFPITIEGVGAHSSRPELGENALVSAATLIRAIADYDAALLARPPHPLLGHGRATPVLMTGGESHSAVPAQAVLTVDRRTLPAEDAATLRAEIEAVIAGAGVKARVGAPAPEVAGLDTPEEAAILRAALAAAARVGAPAAPVAFPGGTDAPNFGCPAVICGPGDLAQAHAADEYIELAQLSAAARLYLEIARIMLKGR
ncbi:M20 family metallopeptidase [Pikeienuella piscinae]|uniref:M20 family metallopeptidase n=1 Tax=Pikeienuella piscinae TaxID=2748098 RepID=A0A7L5BZN7_9RHOB|nr:M20 family metallopeptidase [Pikeienuella piscinae]QIE55726.1 M20 family metallopeptidase [Pikeienuella piscinae]